MTASRISANDLEWAAEWIASYDTEGDDEDGLNIAARRDRVAAWLNAEIARRRQDAVIREAAKQIGRKPSEVKAALRRKAAREAA